MAKSSSVLIKRYTASDRLNHWTVAITFMLLALSGLALFHPAFFFLTHLFGGGPWTRILHPFAGVLLFAGFVGMMLRFWKLNRITADDRQWLRQVGDVIRNREDRLPPVGHYNAGQKYLFWTMVVCIPLLLLTGVLVWRPYFAPLMPIFAVRLAVLLHAVAAFVIIAGIVVHIYAAIWVQGSVRAMTRGTVTRAWAKQHHPAWYREITK